MVSAAKVASGVQTTSYKVGNETSVRRLLQEMSALLTTYCVPLLRGDRSAWSKLVSQRDADAAHYAIENRVRLALNSATAAWYAKDFEKVMEVLGPLKPMLGASDRAKLEYAERKLQDD